MFDLNQQPSAHLQKRLQKDAELLDAIKAKMMIKCGRELDSAPTLLPFGWAAILELYNQR